MNAGFTLLEVLVALVVIALIAAAVLDTQATALRLERAAQDLPALRLAIGPARVASRLPDMDWPAAGRRTTNGTVLVDVRPLVPPPGAAVTNAAPRLCWTLALAGRPTASLTLLTRADAPAQASDSGPQP